MAKITLYQMIEEKVYTEYSQECWLWPGSTRHGYGMVWVSDGRLRKSGRTGQDYSAHIIAYELRYGPVPDGMELDHVVCQTKPCWNPEHCEPVTHIENMQRVVPSLFDVRSNWTHCKHGHEFTDSNTYRYSSTGYRMCRTCNREGLYRTGTNARKASRSYGNG